MEVPKNGTKQKSQSPQTGQVYFNVYPDVYPGVYPDVYRHNPLKRVKFISIWIFIFTI